MGGLAPNSVFVVNRDVITYFKFGDDRFWGLVSAECQILPFSIDFDGRPYNSHKILCERVMKGLIVADQLYTRSQAVARIADRTAKVVLEICSIICQKF